MAKLKPGYYKYKEFNEHSSAWLEFESSIPTIERFLKDIHGGAGRRSSWYFIDLTKRREPSYLKHVDFKWVEKYIPEFKNDRHEVYFDLCPSVKTPIPYKNKPGERWVWRRGLPNCFVLDLDLKLAGGKTKSEIQSLLNLICEKFKIPYTHIVDTRNGYHVYWRMSEPIPESYWKTGQVRLAEILKSCGAEEKSSLGVCPRLPYTNHWKSNPTPYGLSVRFSRQRPFSLIWFLDTIKDTSKKIDVLSSSIDRVKAEPKIKMEDQELDRRSEIGDALADAKHDGFLLASYLGVDFGKSGSFSCPFHEDPTPSAGIFKSKKGNHSVFMFNCFSKKCRVAGDIITMIKRKENLEGINLVKRVLELSGRQDLLKYGIQGNISHLNENLILLENFLAVILFYNHGTKVWIGKFLRDFIELAKRKVRNSEGTFPASFKEIAKGRDPKRATYKVYLLRLIGLLERVEVPESCREIQRLYKIRTGALNDTSWHHIPVWTEDRLSEAFKTLEEALRAGINVKSCTVEQVTKQFGKDAADRVFQRPYLRPSKPSPHPGQEEASGLSEAC